MRFARMAVVTVAAAALLALGLAGVGWWLFGRGAGAGLQAQGAGGVGWVCSVLDGDGGAPWGAMGGSYRRGGQPAPEGQVLTLGQARAAVEAYIAGDSNLGICEIMEFSNSFYALVEERNTGRGAMELLVDKWDGAVGPEYGPNMMWNAKYGRTAGADMMAGWGRSTTGEMTVTSQDALHIVQEWLDANLAGVTAEEHAYQFYGYYTVYTHSDGRIDGMLSVHGSTGQVWYHTWHGDFIGRMEPESDELQAAKPVGVGAPYCPPAPRQMARPSPRDLR